MLGFTNEILSNSFGYVVRFNSHISTSHCNTVTNSSNVWFPRLRYTTGSFFNHSIKLYQDGVIDNVSERVLPKRLSLLDLMFSLQLSFWWIVFHGCGPKDKDVTSQQTAGSTRQSPWRHSFIWHSCCLGKFYFKNSLKGLTEKQSLGKLNKLPLLKVTAYGDRNFF